MQLSTEEFLTLQGSMSRKDADNALLQREIERLTGEVKRLSDENERLRACQAGASPAVAGKPGYVLLSIDAVCNLFRNIRNVKFVSFLYLVFSKIMPPDSTPPVAVGIFFIWVQTLDGYETLQKKIKLLDVSSVRYEGRIGQDSGC